MDGSAVQQHFRRKRREIVLTLAVLVGAGLLYRAHRKGRLEKARAYLRDQLTGQLGEFLTWATSKVVEGSLRGVATVVADSASNTSQPADGGAQAAGSGILEQLLSALDERHSLVSLAVGVAAKNLGEAALKTLLEARPPQVGEAENPGPMESLFNVATSPQGQQLVLAVVTSFAETSVATWCDKTMHISFWDQLCAAASKPAYRFASFPMVGPESFALHCMPAITCTRVCRAVAVTAERW
jgi:hypothetical protein